MAHLIYRSKLCGRKIRFLKEGYKTTAKNRWSWRWPDKHLEHSSGNGGPIKYKIGDRLKKLRFLGLHVCGVNTRPALQMKAKNISCIIVSWQTFGETESSSSSNVRLKVSYK